MVKQQASPDNHEVIERATAFIKRNIVAANYNRFVCGDGRYPAEVSQGGLRIFGEDTGALAAFWQVGREKGHFTSVADVGKCVQEYKRAKAIALQSLGTVNPDAFKLYLHTDHHGMEEGTFGCGHMKNLAEGLHTDDYGSSGEELNALFAYIKDPESHIDFEETPLRGKHAEGAIILVDSDDFSVNSSDDTGEMHFVVDMRRVRTYFNRLSTALHVKGIGEENLMSAYLRHQGVTAGILAPGKPVLHVEIANKNAVTIRPDSS